MHFPKLEALADLYFRALHSRFTCICVLFSTCCFSVEKLPEDANFAKRCNKYPINCYFHNKLSRQHEEYLKDKCETRAVL